MCLCTVQAVPSQRSATVNGKGVRIRPTAVQVEGDEQETPLKKSPFPSVPAGVTTGWAVQLVPSQRSGSNPESVSLCRRSGTCRRRRSSSSRGLPRWVRPGHSSWCHLPCSVTVPGELNEVSSAAPTAVQADADVHETPPRKLKAGPLGNGADRMLQRVPSRRSTKTPAAVQPTAVHAEEEVQETAFRADPGLSEVRVGWMLQLVEHA